MTTTTHHHLIAGDTLSTSTTYEVTDPYTEQVIAAVADGDRTAADAAVAAAAEAREAWAATPVETRRRVLGRAGGLLKDRRDELVDLAIADTGARRAVAEETQVDAALARLRHWATLPADLLTVPAEPVVAGLAGTVTRTPVGVVGCISPYNFPLLAMVAKVAPALFAGNTVVMKPAPQDPLLVIALTEALNEALRAEGAPAGAVNLVTGAGAEPGAALVDHPEVGAISFTGSTVVGTEIYRAAAPGMKRLLLELGGKGALIVRADADLDAVVAGATRAWTVHSGQICVTPSRVIVDASVHDELVGRLRTTLGSLVHGDPRDPATTTVPLISEVQRDRVGALVASARAEGGTVHTAANVPDHGYFHPATLVTGVGPETTVMQEEAFGPVVCVTPTSSDDEAVAIANSTRYGLTDQVYSRDLDAARRLAARLAAAQVGINTCARRGDLPFGGNKASGIGRSGGTYALDSYTELRATVYPTG
ncbi:Acyl-CoA reductase [Thermomonospora echinospora]|uniref:Acyl-CoA reductase n=1 Tax=Thermomonospora echinospora TaxID=1992 RepID=A0A1H6DLT5_9ACTN|nr:aldehyde dehydrogenase family protein [Thermomonospora echinospora]SEG86260.1 Acyl-CoA reductase [Thermomonospora echinospora]